MIICTTLEVLFIIFKQFFVTTIKSQSNKTLKSLKLLNLNDGDQSNLFQIEGINGIYSREKNFEYLKRKSRRIFENKKNLLTQHSPPPIPLSHTSLFETLERNVRMSPLDLIRAYTFTLSRSCVHGMYIHCFLDVTAHKKT